MRFLKRRRDRHAGHSESAIHEDPLTGVANLFDLTVVFCVALLSILLGVHGLVELLDPETQMVVFKKTPKGKTTMLIKQGKEIKAMKATDTELQGDGVRLGTAYMLQDGTVVYVPD
jgi:hypothetical protein